MKKFLMAAAAAGALLMSGSAAMAEAVKLQLKWVTQAQFAGYYVAAAKGFYKDAGLDVTIMPGGPDINPQQVLAGDDRGAIAGADVEYPAPGWKGVGRGPEFDGDVAQPVEAAFGHGHVVGACPVAAIEPDATAAQRVATAAGLEITTGMDASGRPGFRIAKASSAAVFVRPVTACLVAV